MLSGSPRGGETFGSLAFIYYQQKKKQEIQSPLSLISPQNGFFSVGNNPVFRYFIGTSLWRQCKFLIFLPPHDQQKTTAFDLLFFLNVSIKNTNCPREEA